MALIYMDNNATTRVDPEVFEAMVPFLTDQYFNPSSMYDAARGPGEAVAQARRSVAKLLKAGNPNQILFTSCATESNSTAILGAARANPHRRHIITTEVEHPAILELCKDMRRQGYEVDFLPVDRSGRVDLSTFVRVLRRDTLIVSIMHANNESGVILPIARLSRLTKETSPDIVFHTDATQSVGKIEIDLRGRHQHVDMLSLSGHKLHAPKGVGALFTRRGTRRRPFLIGGHQESGHRAGTENVAFIVGLGKACDLAAEHLPDEQRVAALRDRMQKGFERDIPYLEVNGAGAARLPNTLNVAVHFIEGEAILYQLSANDICASSGSACTSGSLEPSHVLKAMNVPFTAMHGSVRFSLSRYTTEEEVDKVLDVFPEIVSTLRKISPYWDSAKNAPREMPGL